MNDRTEEIESGDATFGASTTPSPASTIVRVGPAPAVVAARALVVLERGRTKSQLPAAWGTVFGNAPFGDVLSRFLGDFQVSWGTAVLPEEHRDRFLSLHERPVAVVSYDGQLRLPSDAIPQVGADGLFVLINGRQFPLCDLQHAMNLHRSSRCDATFFEIRAPQPANKAYEEKLQVNADGTVQRVSRVYAKDAPPPREDGRWPALVLLSAAAMRHLLDVTLPQRLDLWPMVLLRAGLRVNGCTVDGTAYDLANPDAVTELADVILKSHPQWLTAGMDELRPRVWVGRNTKIHPGAELIAPLAIGDGVEIGADAVVVGPAVIGRSSHVSAGAVVRRGLIAPASIIVSNPHVPHPSATEIRALRRKSASHDRSIRLQTVLEGSRGPRLGGFTYWWYNVTKRVIDLIGALVFLTFTLPVYPLIALAIKLNSPGGPVFYGHPRQGRGGRNFKCWKFRTMVPNADEIKKDLMSRNEVDGPQFKMKDDPRIFFVGRILRRLNFDEWPQAWNVLFGSMSLVGPRPSPEKENQMCPAWREARLSVRPGITGLWQVCRRREGETDFQEWIYYDVQYVKHQSIRQDLWILLRTVRVALKGS